MRRKRRHFRQSRNRSRARSVLRVRIVEGGFPHSEIHGSKLVRSSPRLIAAYHVLHRLSAPRHPPNALKALDRSHDRCPPPRLGAQMTIEQKDHDPLQPRSLARPDEGDMLAERIRLSHIRPVETGRQHVAGGPCGPTDAFPLHDDKRTRTQRDPSDRHSCETCTGRTSIAPPGGARRDRTDDLMLAKHALSQLSYGPVRTPKQQRDRWWAWEDLNFRPHAYQARALTN